MEILTKHIETIIILAAILLSNLWIDHRFNKIFESTNWIKLNMANICSNKDLIHSRHEKTETEKNMNHSQKKLFENVKNLRLLLEQVKVMDFDKYSKERIEKCIDSELDSLERDLIKSLGKEEYEKIKK